jgi:small multidrug resistance pump
MAWLILLVAIVAEVTATSAMKLSNGFTRFWPAVVMVLCYCLSMYLLSLILKTLPVGVVYAVWSGSGVALITLVGHFFFKQRLDKPALLGIGLIVCGVVVLQLFSRTAVV